MNGWSEQYQSGLVSRFPNWCTVFGLRRARAFRDQPWSLP